MGDTGMCAAIASGLLLIHAISTPLVSKQHIAHGCFHVLHSLSACVAINKASSSCTQSCLDGSATAELKQSQFWLSTRQL
ncbi:hypothetical protein B0J13DRAFT_555126, partial [Dactylonectria estremocensis]